MTTLQQMLADDADDEEQPLSLDQWVHRRRADVATMRRQLHELLDAILDRQLHEFEVQVATIVRDVEHPTSH